MIQPKGIARGVIVLSGVIWLCGLGVCLARTDQPAPPPGGGLKPFTDASEGLNKSAAMAKAMAKRAESAAQWAAAFRAAAAADLPAALKQFKADEAFAFLTAHESYRQLPGLWTYFFCNAVPMMASPGRGMMNVAYYNPFVDVAIVTFWQWGNEKDGPRLLHATIKTTGEFCTGQRAEARVAPAWLASADLPQEVLSVQYRRFLRAAMQQFETPHEAYWRKIGPASPRTLESAAVTLAQQLGDLIELRKGPLGQPVIDLCKAVQAGDAKAIAATLAPDCRLPVPDLDSLPAPIRQNAVPMATVVLGDGALVFLGNPRLMETYFVALIQSKPKVQLKMFGVYSLMPLPGGRPTGVPAGK